MYQKKILTDQLPNIRRINKVYDNSIRSCFDDKFTIILSRKTTLDHYSILDWINLNSSGRVSSKSLKVENKGGEWTISSIGEYRSFFGFENSDDALLFKIRFIL